MKRLFALILLVSLLTSCGQAAATASSSQAASTVTPAPTVTPYPTAARSAAPTPSDSALPTATPFVKLAKYDAAGLLSGTDKTTYEEGEYNPKDIFTYTFDEGTVFKGSEDIAEEVLENGKNPGLGVRALHDAGITGEGVNVAIIDQPLQLDHPEYADNIAAYYDTGCDLPEDQGSYGGPAVASVLAGKTIGVAPGAKVYYAAVPVWKQDCKYFADALQWIIQQNRKLPEGQKIRVVSISYDLSSSYFSENQDLYDNTVKLALKQGILVLDCRYGVNTGLIGPAYYDPTSPEDVDKCRGGFPPTVGTGFTGNYVDVPCSYRTVAEELVKGSASYAYWGQGLTNWAVPYGAGILALGWQVNPNLSINDIVNMLQATCRVTTLNERIVDPAAFIAAVEATVK
ncbi:MAG: hypothetical protein FWF44_00495 [Defluviitaleaceae bacterium]|nr:hypothetical protein [Defluviitaleaceae bacterium]